MATTTRRLAVVALFTFIAVGGSWLLMPKTEYLPVGNNNFLFGVMIPPPGYNLAEVAGLRSYYEEALQPLWESEPGSAEAEAQPGGGMRGFWFVALPNQAFIGVNARDPASGARAHPADHGSSTRKFPRAFVVVNQSSIFQRGFDEGRNIDINIVGPELPKLMTLGQEIFGQVRQKLPGAQGRPIPGLTLDNPEIQVVTHRRRAAELGLSNRELGFAVSALVDGAKASDYQLDGREIDIRVMADIEGTGAGAHRTHRLGELPIATPDGRIVTLDSVAELVEVNGPVQINHRERERAITLRITPAETMALEEAMDIVENGILAPMRADGKLGRTLPGQSQRHRGQVVANGEHAEVELGARHRNHLSLDGGALRKLSSPLRHHVQRAARSVWRHARTLYGESFHAPAARRSHDARLHHPRGNGREQRHPDRAPVAQSHEGRDGAARGHPRKPVENRIRPIFMSVSTSVFGMLPLVIFPGAGAELYRGLGSVVVGGLVVSTVFTLFLVPALFSLTLDAKAGLTAALRGFSEPAEGAAD